MSSGDGVLTEVVTEVIKARILYGGVYVAGVNLDTGWRRESIVGRGWGWWRLHAKESQEEPLLPTPGPGTSASRAGHVVAVQSAWSVLVDGSLS